MIVGHIGVRKGSKGLPGKNKKIICGKRLIDWSLDQLINHHLIDKVVVSTDDEEILNHSHQMGAIDIGIRPAELATDKSGKWGVWQDSLNKVEEEVGAISAFVDLDATSPLRDYEDITKAIELFFENKPDMVMSCCIARKNPYFNLVEMDHLGRLRTSKESTNSVLTRQSAPQVFEHAASTYVISPDYLRLSNSIYEGNVIPYVMEYERCIDIDSDFDFKIVEFLLKEKYL